ELVAVNRSDGFGVARLIEQGIAVAVLSSEAHGAIDARCRKLRASAYTGVANKLPVFEQILRERGVSSAEVIYVGNDVNDLECMTAAGLSVAVADAHPDVLRRADVVLTRPGGSGAVREICDLILRPHSEPST